MTLKLRYPTKPFIVTQVFGISNASYKAAGIDMTHHNGIDFIVDDDGIVNAMCEGVVTDVGFNDKAGNYVKYRTRNIYNVLGEECYVEFMYMHAEKIFAAKNQIVSANTPLMLADNTGFSTGPHTHISAYRIGLDGFTRLDREYATNFCFDWQPFLQYEFELDMKRGDRGYDVMMLQKRLSVDPTGFYGPVTQMAVFNYQLDHVSLSWVERYAYQGKYCGKKTREALNRM